MAHSLEEIIDGIKVVYVSGCLTSPGVEDIRPRFDALMDLKGVRAVIDLQHVDSLTTPAISLFLGTARAIEQNGGKMVLANASRVVLHILRCCRLDAIFDIAPDVVTAIELLRSHET